MRLIISCLFVSSAVSDTKIRLSYNNTPYTFCPIKGFPANDHPTGYDNNLFIVCAPSSKLSTDAFFFCRLGLRDTTDFKLLSLIVYICKFREFPVFSDCIVQMGYTCTLQSFLELEPCLATFMINLFNLLMACFCACATSGCCEGMATNDRTDRILICMVRAEAMSVVFERDFTVMDSTTGTSNRDTINNHNPDLFTIFIDT